MLHRHCFHLPLISSILGSSIILLRLFLGRIALADQSAYNFLQITQRRFFIILIPVFLKVVFIISITIWVLSRSRNWRRTWLLLRGVKRVAIIVFEMLKAIGTTNQVESCIRVNLNIGRGGQSGPLSEDVLRSAIGFIATGLICLLNHHCLLQLLAQELLFRCGNYLLGGSRLTATFIVLMVALIILLRLLTVRTSAHLIVVFSLSWSVKLDLSLFELLELV